MYVWIKLKLEVSFLVYREIEITLSNNSKFEFEVSLGFWFPVSLTRFRGLEPQASREGGLFHLVRVCLDGYLDRTVSLLPVSSQMVQGRRLDGSLWTVMV